MLCPACDLPLLAGEPRVVVDNEPVHEHHASDGAAKACNICWLVHAPGQIVCEW